MEKILNFLADSRLKYSNLLIEIGLSWIESNRHSSPEEFLDEYLPPREIILEILNEERMTNRLTRALIPFKSIFFLFLV